MPAGNKLDNKEVPKAECRSLKIQAGSSSLHYGRVVFKIHLIGTDEAEMVSWRKATWLLTVLANFMVRHWQASNGHPEVSLLGSGRGGDVDSKWFSSSPYSNLCVVGSGVVPETK